MLGIMTGREPTIPVESSFWMGQDLKTAERRTVTKSMVDNLEGYPDAIKFLKKNTAWTADSLLLSDVMTTDEKYRINHTSILTT